MKSFTQKAQGAVLVVALVFLLLLALIATTIMQTSQMEFRMAGNEQFREEAFQLVQGIASQLSADNQNFPVTGEVDDVVATLNTTPAIDGALTADVSYAIVRKGPLILESIPFRQDETETSSVTSYDAAIFEVDVSYDGSAKRLGSAHIAQGIAVKIVASTQ